MPLITVGTDGSPGALAAMDWAIAEATLRGADLRIVHAWSPAQIGPYPYVAPDAYAVFEQAARDLLDRVADDADAASGGRCERVLTSSPSAGALIAAAETSDLLVLGARGHGGFIGLLLGSVSSSVAHHCPCPLVIVPAPAP